MIDSINLKNYKAFESVTIPIKPLTILLGANSVGKSSIIQMLMLLHQTAEERFGMYSSALKIYGNYVNIGAFENLFRNLKTNDPLIIQIRFHNDAVLKKIRGFRNEMVDSLTNIVAFMPTSDLWKDAEKGLPDRKSVRDFVQKFWDLMRRIGENDNQILSFIKYRMDIPYMFEDDNIDNILKCYDLREHISNIEDTSLGVTYELVVEDARLKIKKFIVDIGNECKLLEIENKTESNIKVSSFVSLDKQDRDYIESKVNFGNTIFGILSGEKEVKQTMVSDSLVQLASIILENLQAELSENRVNYVSPLRAHPKRYYMLDKAKMTISLDTLDGDAIAEVLKENGSIKRKVNGWFGKFGFKIDVKPFKEVIHHMFVTQNGLPLDITDVGFGISQVLPIIIQGFLSEKDSVTIIEQPEIHLHPKMQADLGDLLIDVVNTDHKKLVVETHSEYILRRIRRRMSEGKIKKEDVSICLFHPKEKDCPAWVEILDIGEKGAFKWPEDYYDGELTLDVTEFLKNQN